MGRSTPEVVIPRIGGKARMSTMICEGIEPLDFGIYVEPFCGSCAVFLKFLERGGYQRLYDRGYNPTFVLNDIDQDIYNLFKVVRERGDELAEAIKFTPYSRDEHQFCKQNLLCDDDLERARRYLVRCWQSVSGRVDNSWGVAKCGSVLRASLKVGDKRIRNGGTSNQSAKFNTIPDRIKMFCEHLKLCYIESLDFKKIIEFWDSELTLFYCDPPYVTTEKYYSGSSFSLDDHYKLADLLHSVKGHVALTYYPHPLIKELYKPEEWDIVTRSSYVSSAVKHKANIDYQREYKEEWLLIRKNQTRKTFIIPTKQMTLF